MITAKMPRNETQRLAALAELKLLDTPPEERFDRITRLAKRLFKVPFAVVSLVDSRRQWFKSAPGLSSTETPRDISFCGHAILQDGMMIVPDALLDARFADNPMVTGEQSVRFYAGMPLKGRGGEKVGTLCLFDRVPRAFGQEERETLRDLSAMVEDELNALELNATVARVREGESKLEDLLENVDDLVMLVTPEGRFVYVNQAWRDRLGYNETELSRLTIGDIMHPEDRAHGADLRRRVMSGEKLHDLRLTFKGKDGRAIPVEGSVSSRFKDGSPYYTRGVFHDVTERLKIDQLKTEAVSLASHELRTPLAVVLVALQAIELSGKGEPSAKTQEFLEMARRNAQRLLDLVNRYLDVSRIESGEMDFDFQTLDLKREVERAVEDMRPYGQKRGVSFEVRDLSPGVRVKADAGRLQQVLTNLMSNAAKFSPEGGAVTVTTRSWEGAASVAVSDQGPGISPEFQARVFAKFAQDRSTEVSGEHKGTGLGLSIAKAIIDKMGGRIGFGSEPGKGATFRFTLPVIGR